MIIYKSNSLTIHDFSENPDLLETDVALAACCSILCTCKCSSSIITTCCGNAYCPSCC